MAANIMAILLDVLHQGFMQDTLFWQSHYFGGHVGVNMPIEMCFMT